MLHVRIYVLVNLVGLSSFFEDIASQLTILSCWDTYYYSYLQVVNQQSITNAGYILNAFSLMSAFISPFTGL